MRAVLDLCAALARAGHEVTLLTADGADLPDAWREGQPGEPRCVVIDPPKWPGGYFSRTQMRDNARHLGGADVVHLHSMWTPSNPQFAAAARASNVPYIVSVHGMLDDWCMSQRRLKKQIYLAVSGRAMLHGAYAVHCTAEAELEQARQWFPKGHGEVVPLPMDLRPFLDAPGPELARQTFPQLADDATNVLYLSRLHYKKGIEHLLQATVELKRRSQPIRVLLAGTDLEQGRYERKLKDRTSALGLDDEVKFLGFVSGPEKVSLYQAADLFVLPTSQENFGFVLFEALAAGTPVITTKGADTWPEMVASGGSVIVDQEAGAIADQISELAADADRRRRMGASGRAWALANLSDEAILGGYERMYTNAAGSTSENPGSGG